MPLSMSFRADNFRRGYGEWVDSDWDQPAGGGGRGLARRFAVVMLVSFAVACFSLLTLALLQAAYEMAGWWAVMMMVCLWWGDEFMAPPRLYFNPMRTRDRPG
jgi:hypothetical protein